MPAFDKEKARIKMVALTRTGHDNVTWYNYEKVKHKRSELIVEKMLARFKRTAAYAVTNVIQFYENGTRIHTEKK